MRAKPARSRRGLCAGSASEHRRERERHDIDTATATLTVRPNWKKKRPTMPFMKATGTNTARIDDVVASTARKICAVRVEGRLASAASPISRWRWMFSMTTIASSIRMPIDSDSASIVMLLKVKPSHCMNANVATTLVGIATALISVARRSRRNSRMITTASNAPNTRSNCTSWIERSM